MTRDELRLELLRITKPHGIDNPDVEMWLARAKAFEAWVNEPLPPPTVVETPKRLAGTKPVERTAKAVYSD
jgi:hypothetical protein